MWQVHPRSISKELAELRQPLLEQHVKACRRQRSVAVSFPLSPRIHVAVALVALGCIAHHVLMTPIEPIVAIAMTWKVVPGRLSKQMITLLQQIGTPASALLIGFILHRFRRFQGFARLLVYFGAQTGMHLYMKVVLSNAIISEELAMKGIPAAFLVTALQQVTSFAICLFFVVLSWNTPFQYAPRILTSRREYFAVISFALSFAFNIGLNNFSLSLLSISMNLIIRSCLPLSTAASQVALGFCTRDTRGSMTGNQVLVMLIGVFFAGLATIAKAKAASEGMESEHFFLGLFVGMLSIFSGAINFVLADFLGSSIKLNALDTTWYMAIPVTLFLSLPIFLMPHPVGWPGFGSMTDFQVFLKVLELSPSTLGHCFVSGFFASSYNVLQYTLVQSQSATYTALAGNFNKAATVLLSFAFGLEQLPHGQWGGMMFMAILGNIVTFTVYGIMKTREGNGGRCLSTSV